MPRMVHRLPVWTRDNVLTSLSPAEYTEGMRRRRVPEAHKSSRGRGIRVAVLDTGCQIDHPEFSGAIAGYRNFTNSPDGDNQGHGTHVAGTIGARENDRGVIGVAPECELLIAKVLGDDGSGYGQWIAGGIQWAVQQDADIISMSLGSAGEDRTISRAVDHAVREGSIMICAAGNDGRRNSVNWPAKHTDAIAVGATNDKGEVAEFSSRGPEVDIAAPGVNILSTWPGDRYVRISGTSMATPFVTGCVALALADGAEFDTPNDLRNLLAETAEDVGRAGRDSDYGYGLINPDTMLEAEPDETPPVDPGEPEPDYSTIDLGIAQVSFPARPGDDASIRFGKRAGGTTLRYALTEMADQLKK